MSGEDYRAAPMSEDEAEDFVVRLLRTRGALTTREIETSTAREGRRCPDQTVVFLTKMRGKGLIEGEVSIEKRGWIWRLPLAGTDAQTPPG